MIVTFFAVKRKGKKMKANFRTILTSTFLSLSVATCWPAFAANPTSNSKLTVGLITTLSGGGAILGEELKRGWDLGMQVVNNKIGGLETEVIVDDDQMKPDVAVSTAQRMVTQQKVDVVAGVLWSNILLAIRAPVLNSGTILLSTNAGPDELAGKQCNKLFLATSWQNDQWGEATARLLNADNLKDTYLIGPNYQAGKTILTAVAKGFKGKVDGLTLFKLGQTDFQAELSELRAKHPKSVVAFAPGSMGIAFIKQWHALGLSKTIPLYTINMIDYTTLPAMGDAAEGSLHVSVYDPSSKTPVNEKFVSAFKARYHTMPTQYAVQAYDAVLTLDAGIRALHGNISDKAALVRAMRQAKIASPRGTITYNNNNFPIQDWYKLKVVKGANGSQEIVKAGLAAHDLKDAFYQECPLKW